MQFESSDRNAGEPSQGANVSVDCVDCNILERTPFSPELYSYNLNLVGLRYGLTKCLPTGTVA